MRKALVLTLGLALAAAALLPSPASAQVQGLYYQEVEKDGRVYAFNTPERFKSWSESGEIGTAITLIGAAEGGKTLVAENETAADLYFFKHNLPGYERPTPPPAKPAFTVGWKDGKTSIESKSAKLDISNRVQIRWTDEDLGENSSTAGPERGSFRIRRAKTKFEGWVYTKNLTYELQLNWPDTANPLEDANVNYDFTNGKKAFQIKAGQYKVPFGRQELTSSGSQQFVDRSIVSAEYARGRDIGVQLWGQPLGGKFDWRVGLFNGNGRTTSRNDNDDYQLDARLAWQPFGDVKYSESDFEGTSTLLFALAAGYETNTRPIVAAGTTPAHDREREITAFDAVLKYKGLSIMGERFESTNDRTAGVSDFDDEGTHVQVGYFVIPAKFEVAVRWAEIDPNLDRANDVRTESGFGLNYFFNKHAHKIQLDYREIEDEARRNNKDKEIRLQYQIIF